MTREKCLKQVREVREVSESAETVACVEEMFKKLQHDADLEAWTSIKRHLSKVKILLRNHLRSNFNLADPDMDELEDAVNEIHGRQRNGEIKPDTAGRYMEAIQYLYDNVGRLAEYRDKVESLTDGQYYGGGGGDPVPVTPSMLHRAVRWTEKQHRTAVARRRKTLLYVLFVTIIRSKEALMLKWEHVDFDDEEESVFVKLSNLKQGKQSRKDVSSPLLYRPLKELREHTENEYVFGGVDGRGGDPVSYNTLNNDVEKAVKCLDEDITPHDFRHGGTTFRVMFREEDMEHVQRIGGWDERSSMEHYIHRGKMTERLEHEGFHPANGDGEQRIRKLMELQQCVDCRKDCMPHREVCGYCRSDIPKVNGEAVEEARQEAEILEHAVAAGVVTRSEVEELARKARQGRLGQSRLDSFLSSA